MLGRHRWVIAGAVVVTTGAGAVVGVASSGPPRAGLAPGVRGACPRTEAQIGSGQGDAAKAVLVPDGASGLLLCRYRGLNPDPRRVGTLVRSREITAPGTVAELTQKFDALKPLPQEVLSCPSDDGSKIVAVFRYPQGAEDPVVVDPGGCRPVTNGQITRSALFAPGGDLVRRLLALTGLKICGQVLWDGAGDPVVVMHGASGRFAVAAPGFPDVIVLRFSRGCSRGVRIRIRPAGALRVVKRARARDGLPVAVTLEPQTPGPSTVTATRSSGRQTIVTIITAPLQ